MTQEQPSLTSTGDEREPEWYVDQVKRIVCRCLYQLARTEEMMDASAGLETRMLRLARVLTVLEQPDSAMAALKALREWADWVTRNYTESDMQVFRPMIRRYMDVLKERYS